MALRPQAKLTEMLSVLQQLGNQGVPLADCVDQLRTFVREALEAAFSGDLGEQIERTVRDALEHDAAAAGGGEAYLQQLLESVLRSGGLANHEKLAERLVGLDGTGAVLRDVAPGLLAEVKGAVRDAVDEANARRGAAPPMEVHKHVYNTAEVHYISKADVRAEVKAEIQKQFMGQMGELREDFLHQASGAVKTGARALRAHRTPHLTRHAPTGPSP